MDVKVKNEKNGTRTWQVVIEDDKLIKITPEPDYLYFAWFGQYDLTVESIFRFGNDFCFAYHECLIKINSEYLFPEVLVYPPTGIVVENFQVCETLDRCVLGE